MKSGSSSPTQKEHKMSKKSNVVTNKVAVEATEVAPTWNIHQLMIEHKSKSGVIRYLDSQGVKRGEIVKIFTDGGVKMIYQHVRNVLITPVKRG